VTMIVRGPPEDKDSQMPPLLALRSSVCRISSLTADLGCNIFPSTCSGSDCMDLGHSLEAASYAATQELSNTLRNRKVHYRIHKSLPLVSALRHIILDHIT
jgi:hypothetical protein